MGDDRRSYCEGSLKDEVILWVIPQVIPQAQCVIPKMIGIRDASTLP